MTRLARLLLRAVRFENVKPNASFPMLGRKWLATHYVPQSHLGVFATVDFTGKASWRTAPNDSSLPANCKKTER